MFGFSFSELIVVVLVALVVMGPKDLPKMLRRVGQWAGKLRRAAADLRAQSGIDDALRSEGLADDINEIRKLARGELDAVRQVASVSADELNGGGGSSSSSSSSGNSGDNYSRGDDFYVVRDREYPRDGADSYNALPENAIVYSDGLPKSAFHKDALYRMGDPDAEIPPDPPAPPGHEPVVGPTLMGIGAEELAKQEEEEKKKKKAAAEETSLEAPAEAAAASEETSSTESDAPTKEDSSSSSSSSSADVGPTLIGVGAVDATGKPHEGAR